MKLRAYLLSSAPWWIINGGLKPIDRNVVLYRVLGGVLAHMLIKDPNSLDPIVRIVADRIITTATATVQKAKEMALRGKETLQ